MHQFLPEGLKLIQEFEGCSLHAYQDQHGTWTIGYGCTHSVTPGLAITQDEALRRLAVDLDSTETLTEHAIMCAQEKCPGLSLNNYQYTALVCLIYNMGFGNFTHEGPRDLLNSGNLDALAQAWPTWDKIRVNGELVESPGLKRRRLAEQALFLTKTV